MEPEIYGKPDSMLLAANGSDINVIGISNVEISHKDITAKATVYVSDSSSINLLGRPQIGALSLIGFVEPVRPFTPREIAAGLREVAEADAGLKDKASVAADLMDKA